VITCAWYRTNSKWASAFPRFIIDSAAPDLFHQVVQPGEHLKHIYEKVLVMCIPGDAAETEEDSEALNLISAPFAKVIYVVFSDERGIFDPQVLKRPNKIVWSFAPQFPIRPGVDRVAPFGWTSAMMHGPAILPREKRIEWCFMGQDSHERRHQMCSALATIPNGLMLRTNGFAKGIAPDMYFEILSASKFGLCPGGPCTADSFRFAETLECGAIPIVDELPGEWLWPRGYWNAVCGKDLPFPVINDWDQLSWILGEWKEDYEAKRDRCMRWWELYKRWLIERMREDLR